MKPKHKKIHLLLFLFITNSLAVIPCYSQAQGTSARPNILWITCEDMSPNLECFGDSTIQTPQINKLAAEGIRYTNLFSVSGVCAPSRSAIITGMYPASIGTHHMRTGSGARAGLVNYQAVPPPEVKCFPEYLRANGYYCTNNEKTDYQFGNPFTAWDESSHQAHWRNRPRGKPFFSVFNIMHTHESQIWLQRGKPLRVDPARVPLPPYYPENPVIRKDMARYYDNIMVMDSIVGGIMQQLKEDGLLNNTIVFFFSDHGAGLPWAKRELYDRGLKAPLIVRFPDKRGAGTSQNELLSFVDLAPTILSLAGIPIPEHLQGQAFLGKQKAADARTYIFAARDRMDELSDLVRAVRDERFKYIRNYQPAKPNYQDLPYRHQMDMMNELLRLHKEGKLNADQKRWFETKPAEELYDTEADPYELKNVAADPAYRQALEKLRRVQNEWTIFFRDKGFTPEKDLLEMMWPGGKQPVTTVPEGKIIHKGAGTSGERMLKLTCPTEGASIAYKVAGKQKEWTLYTSPVKVNKSDKIIAKAIRYGYKPSEEVALSAHTL